MKISALGEDALVAALTRGLPLGPEVRVGPGSDCAVLGKPRDAEWLLLKTDCVVEGVHFLPGENMERVGWKALCRAISDIAAAGGLPQHAVITVAASRDCELSRLTALYAGLRKAARRFGVGIVGGETSRSPGPLFINVALTGRVERTRCVARSGGKPGDLLFVTGLLGGSLGGKHLDFTPRLTEARWLTEHFPLRAMMDVSDGLGADLPRLAKAGGCGFHLDEENVPRTKGSNLQSALSDGEDFELLFALAPRHRTKLEAAWRKRFPRLDLTCVGRLTAPSTQHKSSKPSKARGYDHFA